MPDKHLASVYASRVIAARATGATDEEHRALEDLTAVCRRTGGPVDALLDDAVRRAAVSNPVR